MAKHFKQDVERSVAPSRPRRARRRQVPKRAVLTLVLALAVVGVAVGGVIAWLSASNQVANQFEVGTVTPTVNEDGPTEGTEFVDGDNVKQNVDVTNNGNVPIYVRAQVNIYWQDANGNQLWDEPYIDEMSTGVIPDGTLNMGDDVYESIPSFTLDSGVWVKGADGYYYWTLPLDPETTTSVLIDEFTFYYAPNDGRKLVCDIAVQGIQADPADAVTEAWDVSIDANGVLTPPSAGNQNGQGE